MQMVVQEVQVVELLLLTEQLIPVEQELQDKVMLEVIQYPHLHLQQVVVEVLLP